MIARQKLRDCVQMMNAAPTAAIDWMLRLCEVRLMTPCLPSYGSRNGGRNGGRNGSRNGVQTVATRLRKIDEWPRIYHPTVAATYSLVLQ